jgi:hypothetical protein
MDACDKAAQLLQCGKENSPDAVAGLMSNLENEITAVLLIIQIEALDDEIFFQEAPLILPPTKAVCPTDYQCIVDVSPK